MADLRVGTTLPQFRADPAAALRTARAAEEVGLDGVFVFDHLWPIGQPERPALQSLALLGAIAAETGAIRLGTLVARVGLVPNAVLVNAMATLRRVVGDRLVAGLGTGDRLSDPENVAYGIATAPVSERLALLADCCQRLAAESITTWVGGRSMAVKEAAATWADAFNAWGVAAADLADDAADLARFAAHAGRPPVEVTWGGQVLIGRTDEEAAEKLARFGPRPGLVAGTVEGVAGELEALATAGATWTVCAPLDIGDPGSIELLADVAAAVHDL